MVVVVVPLVGVGVGPAGEVEATDVGVRHAARPRLLHPGRGQTQLAGGDGKILEFLNFNKRPLKYIFITSQNRCRSGISKL